MSSARIAMIFFFQVKKQEPGKCTVRLCAVFTLKVCQGGLGEQVHDCLAPRICSTTESSGCLPSLPGVQIPTLGMAHTNFTPRGFVTRPQ